MPLGKDVFEVINYMDEHKLSLLPMLANGKIFVPLPTIVFPSIWTLETNSTFSANSTFGPMKQKGPIFTFLEMLAFLLITLELFIIIFYLL